MAPEPIPLDIQRFIDDLAGLSGVSPTKPIIAGHLGRAAQRLHLL